MAVETLGLPIDVQGGGNDLIFPHHEMTASQAQVALDQRPFARAYVHAGMVGMEGEKMSKSRGNLVLVSELREGGHDPQAIRLALLARHYRHDREWSGTDLLDATARLERWREAVGRSAGPDAEPLVHSVREALADDLDTPRAIAGIDVWAEKALAGPVSIEPDDREAAAPVLVRTLCDALLGLRLW
jgi:L-cysteine:1D-myo-inositol 2-amino-2-deoxy-alpha-D-glucopyranoside ligase